MPAQIFIAGALVLGCAVYSAWTLMPAGARRYLAQRLLKLGLPARVAARMRRHAQAAGGCGCDGCDQASTTRKAPRVQPIRVHRRTGR